MGEWRVINAGRRWDGEDWFTAPADWVWPYRVMAPEGSLVAITATLWGARRVIRREKAKRIHPFRPPTRWWEQPPVYRETE